MKRHGNTLYVTTQGSYLARDGTNIVVSFERQPRFRAPIHTIESVVCFGNVMCSPFVLGLCGEAGVSVVFLSERGRFLARATGKQSGNILLRRAQHRLTSNDTASATYARHTVLAKIANARAVLQRGLRDHGEKIDSAAVGSGIRRLHGLLRELENELPVERVRGVEGEAARHYFESFDHLIVSRKDDFFMRTRTRRPPQDNMNALLSFIYALLTSDCVAACQSVGLDPQMGFLHADRPGRASLALDLIEEFRPVLADRLALTLVNRNQVAAGGFRLRETGGVEMDDKTRKLILQEYQKRKDDELTHPFLGEKVMVGLLPLVQARLLARSLRGDLDAYPPFFWK